MKKLNESGDFLLNLIRSCEYYDLSEKQSLELINKKFSKPIARSTYYNYKKRLYQDEKFQTLKKSNYKSKMLKSLMLYIDDDIDNPNGYDFNKLISKQFPDKQNIFRISDEQLDKNSRLYNKINSNFCIRSICNKKNDSNLTRVIEIPEKYTLREEYVRCGKQKTNKCKSCCHGPYYYGYWREKLLDSNESILRKKYLGIIDPRL